MHEGLSVSTSGSGNLNMELEEYPKNVLARGPQVAPVDRDPRIGMIDCAPLIARRLGVVSATQMRETQDSSPNMIDRGVASRYDTGPVRLARFGLATSVYPPRRSVDDTKITSPPRRATVK